MEDEVKLEEEGEEMAVETAGTGRAIFGAEYDHSQLPDLLRVYYRWLFPFQEYFKWLCYGE